MQFKYPWVLYLTWLVIAGGVLLGAMMLYRKKKLQQLFGGVLDGRLIPSYPASRIIIQTAGVVAGILLMVVALARPQKGETRLTSISANITILLDVSRSMLVTDISPSRLQRAKAEISGLIRSLRGERISLIVFRHKPVMLCPLTFDYAFATESLELAEPDCAIPGETDVGGALLQTLHSLSSQKNVVILVSDGEDLSEENEVLDEVKKCISLAKDKGIPVFTVGVGTEDGGLVPVSSEFGGSSLQGNVEIRSKLNPGLLRTIAEETGGKYLQISERSFYGNKLATFYLQYIRPVIKREAVELPVTLPDERYRLFLFPSVILLLIILVANGNSSSLNSRLFIKLFIVICNITLWSGITYGSSTGGYQSTREIKAKAYKLYREHRYTEAGNLYLLASTLASERDSILLRYNAGVCYYHSGNILKAVEIFRNIPEEPQYSSLIQKALGYSLFQLAQKTDSYEDRIKLLREAGRIFIKLFRTSSHSDELLQNIFVVIDAMTKAEERFTIQSATARLQNNTTFDIANVLYAHQRDLALTIASAVTDSSPSDVRKCKEVAKIQKSLAYICQTLSHRLRSSSETAELADIAEKARQKMFEVAGLVRKLDTRATNESETVVMLIYEIWKKLVPPEYLIVESITAQTNAISHTQKIMSSGIQSDRVRKELERTGELTRLFLQKFLPLEEKVQEQIKQTVNELANQAIVSQELALKHAIENNFTRSLKAQEASLEILQRIKKLLLSMKPSSEQKEPALISKAEGTIETGKDSKESLTSYEEPVDFNPSNEQDVEEIMKKIIEREKAYKTELRKRSTIPRGSAGKDW